MEAAPIIACTLTDGDLKAQAERWQRVLADFALERTETESGVRISFCNQSTVERELHALAAVENECCSWAVWEVTRSRHLLLMTARATGDGVATLHAIFRRFN